MNHPLDFAQVSSPTDITEYTLPDALAGFSLAELRTFCLISELLLKNGGLSDALKELALKTSDRKSFKAVHKSLKEKLGIDILNSGSGATDTYKTDPQLRDRLRIVTACIVDAVRQMQPVAVMRKVTARPTVRVASVMSVVNLLGPAIIQKLKVAKESSDKWPPNISYHNGEFRDHFRNMLAGNLDLCISPAETPLPDGITSIPLKYTSMEQGIVFRLRDSEKAPHHFKEIEDAVISGTPQQLLNSILQSTVCLMHWELSSGYDQLSRSINDFFCDNYRNVALGPRIYVPTMRSSRQLVCRGLAVGIGHRPRCEKKVINKLQRPIEELGGVAGYDPDFPNALLAFLPPASISTGQKLFPTIPTNSFHLSFVGKSGIPDRNRLSEESIEVAKNIRELVTTVRQGTYLQWDDGTGHLMHDFHWSGQDIDCG